MKNEVFTAIGRTYRMKKLDVREFAKVKGNKVSYTIERYSAEGFGNVAVLSSSGFVNMFKLETAFVTPFNRDLPMMIINCPAIMGTNELDIELYDTFIDKSLLESEYLEKMSRFKAKSELKDNALKTYTTDDKLLPQSVSKIAILKKNGIDELLRGYMSAYGEMARNAPELEDPDKKLAVSDELVLRFLEEGNPIVDILTKTTDADTARIILTKFLFGVRV